MRRHLTGFLETVLTLSLRHNKTLAEGVCAPIVAALKQTKQKRIIDLCSGGGGPWAALQPIVSEKMNESVTVTLTDLYPNLEAFERIQSHQPDGIDFYRDPVDATALPKQTPGVRTVFDGLHHFSPQQAQSVIHAAVEDRAAIVIFEAVARHPFQLFQMVFVLPFLVTILTPFIRPFDWRWIPLTYLFPISTIAICWDGFVSCLRIYMPKDLLGMAHMADPNETFTWCSGSLYPANMGGIYMVGIPKTSENTQDSFESSR